MHNILLIEDSEPIKDLVCHSLGADFKVAWVSRLQEATKILNENSFDLILLDVGLPDGDGFKFFSLLLNSHRFKKIPVIFLTAKDDVSDKVLGISLGAEDYIVKPFQPEEFKARIEMRIKKNKSHQTETKTLQIGNIEINFNSQRAAIYIESKRHNLTLTPLEFKLLTLLISHEDQIFSRNQLMNQVWGEDTYLTDRCIDTHIYLLRKKLGPFAECIQTVYGEGYRFLQMSRAKTSG
ncbi:MAG: response regulator transcription factor [Bdellovibrionales bacterium]